MAKGLAIFGSPRGKQDSFFFLLIFGKKLAKKGTVGFEQRKIKHLSCFAEKRARVGEERGSSLNFLSLFLEKSGSGSSRD